MTVLVRTFSERIDPCLALQAMCVSWGKAQRFLYREHLKGRSWTGDLATKHYVAFGLSAKRWEHCWRDLMGKVRSQAECDAAERLKLERRVEAKGKTIAKAEKRLAKAHKVAVAQEALRSRTGAAAAAGRRPPAKAFDVVVHDAATKTIRATRAALHQHRRKLASLKHELKTWAPRTLCFGGRKLFNAQHHLEDNGYASRDEWKFDWHDARSAQFFCEGDGAHPLGNQFVRLHPRLDGSFDLEVRLPDGLKHLAETCEKVGGRIVHAVRFRGLRFRHGRTELYGALARRRPISWRVARDGSAWRVMAMVGVEHAEPEKTGGSWYARGALGVDLNDGHVAATLVDRFGNPVGSWTVPLHTHGKSQAARLDACRKAAAAVVSLAREHGVPVVSEDLDFTQKKAALRDTCGARRARMLSSFGYATFDAALSSACVRSSIHHRRVNPAFTSVIGDLKYAPRHGLTVHHAAAAVVARRAMRLSERPPSTLLQRRRNGDHVTLARPAWNGPPSDGGKVGHVWSAWRRIAAYRRAALAGPAGPAGRTRRPSDGTAGLPPPAAMARSGGR